MKQSEVKNKQTNTKKPYQTPTLTKQGNLEEKTQTFGNGAGNTDTLNSS